MDLSSCHSHVVAAFLGLKSLIHRSTMDSTLWSEKVDSIYPQLKTISTLIEKKTLKKSLKVSLYSTLNGGNCCGSTILKGIVEDNFSTINDKEKALIYKQLEKTFSDWQLVKELTQLNQTIFTEFSSSSTPQVFMYGVDRIEPYILEKRESYIMISRFLQGYERVLLTVLSYFITYIGGIVISCEHDGCLAAFCYPGITKGLMKRTLMIYYNEII